ncbi:MAG TPA: site-specific integrase [Methanoregulaceae archaeon]|nr:site-specific integrase [Methanoregulaceae archaeon]
MNPEAPFYPHKVRATPERAFRKALFEDRLTEDDRRLIEEYVSEYQALRHINTHRVLKTIYDLISWRRFIPRPFREMTAGDLYAGLNAMQAGTSARGTPYKQNTKHDYIKALKSFVLWLIDNGYSTVNREKVKAIHIPHVDHATTAPDGLLTAEEITRILDNCWSARDRAIVAVLYETGGRIGEIARLRWRDVVFDEYGIRVHIRDTKKNRIRYARCTWAREMLAAWKNVYPLEVVPDGWVFVSTRKQVAMNYAQIRQRIKVAAERAGITKRIHMHLFRKSRITHMIQQNFQESIIKQMMWGNLNTQEFRTYAVLCEADIDAEILDKAGIKQKADRIDPLAPRPCPQCHTIGGPGSRYCSICGQALTTEAAAEISDAKRTLWADPDMLIELAAEIRERNAREVELATMSGAAPQVPSAPTA